jgi:hypothetical protein
VVGGVYELGGESADFRAQEVAGGMCELGGKSADSCAQEVGWGVGVWTAEAVPLGFRELSEYAVEDPKGMSISFYTLAQCNGMPLT